MTNQEIIDNAPDGATHWVCKRHNEIRYYMIIESYKNENSHACMLWKNGRWLWLEESTLNGLITFGILPINLPRLDYSFINN